MEEKTSVKVVEGGKATPEMRKLSYEELENTAHQLSDQSRQLYIQNQKLSQALQEANLGNFYQRLEWLWKVINSPNQILTEKFKYECSKEFESLMTQPEQISEDEAEKSKEDSQVTT